jgi:HEAT repeat protein
VERFSVQRGKGVMRRLKGFSAATLLIAVLVSVPPAALAQRSAPSVLGAAVAFSEQDASWYKRLTEGDAATRKAVVQEVAARRERASGGILYFFLGLRYTDPDPAVREMIWKRFPNLHSEASLREAWWKYEAGAREGDAQGRRSAIQGLNLGITTTRSTGAVQQESIEGPLAEVLRTLLKRAFADPDESVRTAAIRPTLFLKGEERMRLLCKALNSEEERVRTEVMNTLEGLTDYARATKQPGLFREGAPLIPGLVRIIRQDQEWNASRAARFLSAIGEPARAALPDLCAALIARRGQDEFTMRRNIANSIREIAGGPEATVPRLVALLKDKRPETRRSAAGTFGHIWEFLSDRVEKLPDGKYDKPLDDRTIRSGFFNAIPDLAATISDKEPSVRLASARSLGRLADFRLNSHPLQPGPWERTLRPLGRALSDTDTDVAREAAKTLALISADLTPVIPDLRRALTSADRKTQEYATVALAHAVSMKRTEVWQGWQADLTAKDVNRRRRAAEQGTIVAPLLVGSYIWHMVMLPSLSYGEDAVSRWRPPDGSHLNMRFASEAERETILTLISKGLEDSDKGIRISTARTVKRLVKMGEQEKPVFFTDGGKTPLPLREAVKPLIEKARDAVKNDDPELSQHLDEQQKRYAMIWRH